MDETHSRNFQFGLRDLLWVILVVALVLGWRLDRGKYIGQIVQLRNENAKIMHLLDAARTQVRIQERLNESLQSATVYRAGQSPRIHPKQSAPSEWRRPQATSQQRK